MNFKLISFLLMFMFSQLSMARDFEDNYAVYGAGADSCKAYLNSMKDGGRNQDYFIDWTIGYLTAFNVIMPNTYNILGETEFSESQGWLMRHCKRYPKQLYINAMIKLTEVLYPLRYQSSLKKQPGPVKPSGPATPAKKAKPALKDVSKAIK